jgi:hypothetical protein
VRALVVRADDALDLLVDPQGRVFTVVLVLRDLPAKEDRLFLFASSPQRVADRRRCRQSGYDRLVPQNTEQRRRTAKVRPAFISSLACASQKAYAPFALLS